MFFSELSSKGRAYLLDPLIVYLGRRFNRVDPIIYSFIYFFILFFCCFTYTEQVTSFLAQTDPTSFSFLNEFTETRNLLQKGISPSTLDNLLELYARQISLDNNPNNTSVDRKLSLEDDHGSVNNNNTNTNTHSTVSRNSLDTHISSESSSTPGKELAEDDEDAALVEDFLGFLQERGQLFPVLKAILVLESKHSCKYKLIEHFS